jgi:thiamine-monophosphate kinase
MPVAEFRLIERYFRGIGPALDSTVSGIGDDCAVLQPPRGLQLLVTTDTLVEETHFLSGTDPESLGHKVLAVSLSDLAAMGATPRWAMLALSLPTVSESWLEAFSAGFSLLASRYEVQLVGGDTTRGPLSITVQGIGTSPAGQVLYRSNAKPGDGVYVTGFLGDAGLGLKGCLGKAECSFTMRQRLERPEPRVAVGKALCGLASACIDISDGFAADLGHVLESSQVGATVDWNLLPLSTEVRDYLLRSGDVRLPLCAGDDYELCFTVPGERESDLKSRLRSLPCLVTRVGTIERLPGLRFANLDSCLDRPLGGYEHFS